MPVKVSVKERIDLLEQQIHTLSIQIDTLSKSIKQIMDKINNQPMEVSEMAEQKTLNSGEKTENVVEKKADVKVGTLVYLYPNDKDLEVKDAKSGRKYANSYLVAKVDFGEKNGKKDVAFYNLDRIVFYSDKDNGELKYWFPKEGTYAHTLLHYLLSEKLFSEKISQEKGKVIKVKPGVKAVIENGKITQLMVEKKYSLSENLYKYTKKANNEDTKEEEKKGGEQ